MKDWQKIVKYLAIAFAVFLTVSIVSGIFGALRLFGAFSDVTEEKTGEEKIYTFDGEIRRMDIEIGAADFEVREGNAFSVTSNIKNLTVKEANGSLTIKEKNALGIHSTDCELVLTIPKDASFEKVEMETGAGRVTVDFLTVKNLSLELGAGAVTLSKLSVSGSADIDGGAGKLVINESSLNNLELDMGVGELDLSSALSGKGDIDLGVGKADVTLLGQKEDYRIRLNKGMGEATVDGESVSDGTVVGSGSAFVEIDGGVGSVSVEFLSAAN